MTLTANEREKIELAANSYAASQLSAQRASLYGDVDLNPKHQNMYSEFGWTKTPQYSDFKSAYDSIAVAYGVINQINGGSFQTKPKVMEGEEESDSDSRTEWEIEVDKFIATWWLHLKQADKLGMLGYYGGLILLANDGKEPEE